MSISRKAHVTVSRAINGAGVCYVGSPIPDPDILHLVSSLIPASLT